MKSNTREIKKKIVLNIPPLISEHHFQIGDKQDFEEAMKNIGVEKTEDKYNFYYKGIKVFESALIPENKAVLVDKVGNILQVYTLK